MRWIPANGIQAREQQPLVHSGTEFHRRGSRRLHEANDFLKALQQPLFLARLRSALGLWLGQTDVVVRDQPVEFFVSHGSLAALLAEFLDEDEGLRHALL
jgi:hypothetical protein